MHLIRRIAPALLAAFLVTLAGCGGGSTSDGTGSSQPPTGNPTPSPSTSSVSLAWTPPSDSRIVGYRIYYGTSSRNYLQSKGAGLDTGGASSFTVPNLAVGATYYFAVTSYDASRNESDYSGEAVKLVN